MNELLELELDEVSLVDYPANQAATVALFKRETPMDDVKDKIDKAEYDAKVAEVDTLTAEVDRLTKALEATVVKKEEETIEVDGEKIAKSAIPAAILKRLEEVEKEAGLEALRKRADEVIPNIKGTADQRGRLLKSIGGDTELLEMLRAADKLFAEMFKEVGKTNNQDSLKTATEKFDDLVKAYQTAKGGDFYKAYAAVSKTAEGKELLKKSYDEKGA